MMQAKNKRRKMACLFCPSCAQLWGPSAHLQRVIQALACRNPAPRLRPKGARFGSRWFLVAVWEVDVLAHLSTLESSGPRKHGRLQHHPGGCRTHVPLTQRFGWKASYNFTQRSYSRSLVWGEFGAGS